MTLSGPKEGQIFGHGGGGPDYRSCLTMECARGCEMEGAYGKVKMVEDDRDHDMV